MKDDGRSEQHVPTVLVADDDRTVRTLVRVTLLAKGWHVLEATTPDETLAVARRDRPDIVLLDVLFEKSARDGFDVCRELHRSEATRDLAVVMLTARDDPESHDLANGAGAAAYMVKPFGPVELVRMLQVVLDKR